MLTERLSVRGMTCANCASTVTSALESLDGVASADVNAATEEARVEYDPEGVSLSAIYEAIEDAGYEGVTDRLRIDVADMHCANCAETIASNLEGMAGVLRAEVNYATDDATVTYNPATVTQADLFDGIEAAGYSPVRESGDDEERGESASDAARNQEITKQLRLVAFGAAFSIPLLLMMAGELFASGSFPESILGVPMGWIAFGLATPVQVVLGREFYRNSYTALFRNRTANMDVLIALGSTTAYGYSVAVLLGAIPGGLYFDSAALILLFITLGNYLEARSKGQAGDAMRELLEMEAETATLIAPDGTEREVDRTEVQVGDILKVRPGERVPTDGEVIGGESAVDESMVTGESVPVERGPGDEVLGGTINENGVLRVRATRVGEDSTVQRIVELVREAQSRQPDVQRLADRISAHFVPAVIINALIWGGLWFLFPQQLAGFVEMLPIWGLIAGGPAIVGGTVGTFEFAIVVFASAVLIACPCALGLATPAATMVGTAIGARNGVLFAGGDVLERVRDVQTVIFDKTGTLTEGSMAVSDVIVPETRADGGLLTEQSIDQDELLRLAASAESGSEHPIAQAIVSAAADRDLDVGEPETFENEPGRGITATVDGRELHLGNRKLLQEAGIELGALGDQLTELEAAGKTGIVVAVDGQVAGIVATADTVKESAKAAVEQLQDRGIDVWMLTGDNERTARSVAEAVGIPPANIRAEVLPAEKASVVREIQDASGDAMMVGDGVNDAPALTEAAVGAAIGSGTDVAIEAGDVTLVRDDPLDVLKAIRLSVATLRKIRQNLFWALGYNTVMIPLASLGLLQPVAAAAAMASSSVSVLTNSLTFRNYTPDHDYELLGRLRR
ncbi:heavy metal translocating P-type ATPase [Halodesulfurarchaeum formicicum]|uniref:P-type Cu(+) transporter n=1 Tax=Halodesulfurarchaeum formicicum TaxID=1873524 RepID=A0A1J1AD00_9EURY|nr:heavy metal translocating P-type ATPase [Halodesulfurarchaeum formicicum]APE95640.1 Cu+-exporting ATPase [Halodesulfurarchaeum formicicum]